MKEKPIFTTGILSDIHIWHKYPFRTWKLGRALREMKRRKYDAFLSLGDTTDHGNAEHWELIDKAFEKNKPCKDLIIALGNHDTWSPCPEDVPKEEQVRIANDLYMKHRGIISGREYDGKVYFTHIVNGYYFINLASEGTGVGAYISDEQIAWLDAELEKATADNKPVFVSCHQAINKTHGLPATFGDKKYTEMTGGIGPQSDAVKAVLDKYENVFFFSGHSHMGLCGRHTQHSTYEKIGNIHSFNLPCYMFINHDGLMGSGYGFEMKVFADRVEIRTRNFSWHYPMPLYNYTIKLS